MTAPMGRRVRVFDRIMFVLCSAFFVVNVFDAGYFTARHIWHTVVLAALAAVATFIGAATSDGRPR